MATAVFDADAAVERNRARLAAYPGLRINPAQAWTVGPAMSAIAAGLRVLRIRPHNRTVWELYSNPNKASNIPVWRMIYESGTDAEFSVIASQIAISKQTLEV